MAKARKPEFPKKLFIRIVADGRLYINKREADAEIGAASRKGRYAIYSLSSVRTPRRQPDPPS